MEDGIRDLMQGEDEGGKRKVWVRISVHTQRQQYSTATRGDQSLFVDGVALTEDDVAAEQPREKGVMRSRLATVQLPLEKQERLVDRDELGEVRRVLRRRARDGLEPLAPISATEQDGHDQRMGKPDLDAVHETVPCALEDGEVVMVSRVVEDDLQCSGGHIHPAKKSSSVLEKKRGWAWK